MARSFSYIFRRDNEASTGATRRGGLTILLMVMAIMSLSLIGCDRYGLGKFDKELETPGPDDNAFKGSWGGEITWNDFTPSSDREDGELVCRSANGLPIIVSIELRLTPYPDGTGAASGTPGGTSCLIDEDREGNISSIWQVNPEFTTDFGGPMTWKGRTLEITFPGGQILRGELPPDESTITGTITTTMSYGELVGEWFAVKR